MMGFQDLALNILFLSTCFGAFGLASTVSPCARITPLDIVFILDSSGSLGDANWLLVKQFAVSVVEKLSVSASDTQFVSTDALNFSRLIFMSTCI